MQIQSSDATSQMDTPLPASAANSSATGSSADSTTAGLSSTDALGNESTFLQLLVAQIQNQDPTAPMDSSTFLSQLAEFSQLEQLIGIRQDVQQLDPSTTGATSTTPTTSSTSGS
jgi:flagellar basal-body rod modification protein FlgD